MNESIEFAILNDGYKPTDEEIIEMANKLKELWSNEFKELKIIDAGFNGNDEKFLELKVSWGSWIYNGILDLNEEGKKEIDEAIKNHFSIFNKKDAISRDGENK